MTRKAAAPRKPAVESKQNLVDAIVTVRHLQDFIKEHGGLEQALAAVDRVRKLIELTGGFDQLKEALEVVGRETVPPEA
jgi:hypothetical protein